MTQKTEVDLPEFLIACAQGRGVKRTRVKTRSIEVEPTESESDRPP
jgi:hypothetical protein